MQISAALCERRARLSVRASAARSRLSGVVRARPARAFGGRARVGWETHLFAEEKYGSLHSQGVRLQPEPLREANARRASLLPHPNFELGCRNFTPHAVVLCCPENGGGGLTYTPCISPKCKVWRVRIGTL